MRQGISVLSTKLQFTSFVDFAKSVAAKSLNKELWISYCIFVAVFIFYLIQLLHKTYYILKQSLICSFIILVHSNGWFGLWTFQDYFPMKGGGCNSNTPEPAVFRKFIVWNCEKGLEFVNGGALQFTECILVSSSWFHLIRSQSMQFIVELGFLYNFRRCKFVLFKR